MDTTRIYENRADRLMREEYEEQVREIEESQAENEFQPFWMKPSTWGVIGTIVTAVIFTLILFWS